MEKIAGKEGIIEKIENQPVAMLLLKNYIHVQLPLARNGNTPHLEEIEEANQKGLGVSLNSVSMSRSIMAMASRSFSPDICYLYKDLSLPSSWKSCADFKRHLKTDEGCFNEGISYKDGFIFGFERDKLEKIIGDSIEDSSLLFYKNKLVGGEPRGEFYSILSNIYGLDMKESLSDLFEARAVGSGTTSLVSDQCFGALTAGPYCMSKQYRLRKTKKSETMNIGHLLIYESHLKDPVCDELAGAGFEFSDVFDPKIRLIDIAGSLIDISKKIELVKRYSRPSELFDINKIIIYAERESEDSKSRVICNFRCNGNPGNTDMIGEYDITDYMESKGWLR